MNLKPASPELDKASAHPSPEAIDSSKAAIAKAPTLMIEAPDEPPQGSDYRLSNIATLQYIQGIVQGQQAFIITNLLSENSQTLVQPQMVWTIGRNREVAMPLEDRAMSRRHAVLLYLPNVGFHLIDLNSMNGVFVNGKRIQHRTLLKDSDRIRLGSTEFSFFCSQNERLLEPIHPEIFTRFNTPKSRSEKFIDYSELEDSGVLSKKLFEKS